MLFNDQAPKRLTTGCVCCPLFAAAMAVFDVSLKVVYQHDLITCRPASDNTEAKQGGLSGQTLGIIAFVGGLALVLGLGYLFKGKIRHFLDYFIERVDEWGPWGYVAYGVLYTLLEIVALPAIPLTMTAGVLFGIVPGTILVSGAATAAATIAFLIARYAARDKVNFCRGQLCCKPDKL